jgi:hypothetical protein
LKGVTTGAWQVIRPARKPHAGRIIVAAVTKQTWETGMKLVAVPEPGIIDVLSLFYLLRRPEFVTCRIQGSFTEKLELLLFSDAKKRHAEKPSKHNYKEQRHR